MRTIDGITQELYERGQDAESAALTLIRCLDYDLDLVLDHEAYRKAVRTILDAAERAQVRRLADLGAEVARARAELQQESR